MNYLLKIITITLILLTLNSSIIMGEKTISINNNITPPNPPYIDGPTNCKIFEEYKYNFTLTHPEDVFLVSIFVSFGDGTNLTKNYTGTSCLKGWRSGYTLGIRHKWKKSGNYSIKAKVKDYPGSWSDWGTFNVEVIKYKNKLKNPIIVEIINNFYQYYFLLY